MPPPSGNGTNDGAASLPEMSRIDGFREGEARGDGNNCLIHALYQLTNGEDRGSVQEVDNWRQDLLNVHPTLEEKEMLGIYDPEGETLIEWFGVRVQIIQIVNGETITHPVVGTDDSQPIVRVLHEGAHYKPLWPV